MKNAIIAAMLLSLAAGVSANVWINEFVSDPMSGLAADEWVELASDSPTSLEGCYVIENGGQMSILNGTITDFKVIQDPKGTLNNDNEEMSLVCPGFTDTVAYVDGPGKGNSSGINEYGTWQEYSQPTKGQPNFTNAVPEFSTWSAIIALVVCVVGLGIVRKR